jgi:transposase
LWRRAFAPGAVTSTIALRHGLHRNQLYAWRRELRSAVVADAGVPIPSFVPIVAQADVAAGSTAIEVEISGMVLRARPGVDLAFLGGVIGVLKAAV